MDRHIFPERGIAADDSRGIGIFHKAVILRIIPHQGTEIDPAAGTDGGPAADFYMGIDPAAIAENAVTFNNGIRTDMNIFTDFHIGGNNCCRMNSHGIFSLT